MINPFVGFTEDGDRNMYLSDLDESFVKHYNKILKFIQKLDDMNAEDFVHYAKTEIRIFNEDVLK